ncbi:MAG TPA: DNA primase large subunit PriL [candidate division Zixibacteria bacterium]|nr:DNA primase large subunit PriL [candidate division Zixibacteria bacterium]
MQTVFSKFAKNDYTKYPFLKEAAKYLKLPDLHIEDLENSELHQILDRAEERVEEAILYTRVTRNPHHDEDVEILSFTVAIVLAIATQNSFIKKRYALAEAKQAYEDFKLEPKEKLAKIAKNFEWKLALNNDPKIPYEFALDFTDYLRNTTHLREKKWKLINRTLTKGKVYLTGSEAARLLAEEVRRYVEERTETKELPKFPTKISETAERIKKLSIEKIGQTEMEGFPKVITQTAFPPCIQALYQAFSSGRHLSHVGRFTLTSFLVNIGMPSEKVVELFKNISDFNERMTRYQVEHIAGERGSRTHYTTPKCDTLKTHGVCTNPDSLCRRIHHPLGYYRRKVTYTH